jgi:imidazolonepropionase
MTTIDRIFVHANLATMSGEGPGGSGLGIVADGAVAVSGDRIAWVGPTDELPDAVRAPGVEVHDLSGKWLTPGLVDCHTHLVFGGDRADEFEKRLEGVSYEEIARAGGGILSTVRATREASVEELVRSASPRARGLMAEGVTTLEIKSGYGLDAETELRMLRAAAALQESLAVDVRKTFLGLHALPAEWAEDRPGYVQYVVEEVLEPALAEGLVDAVDAFCEGIAFRSDECRAFFEAAQSRGRALRLHADQLSDLQGGALAAEMGALSADHLEYASEASAAAMGEAGTVAVLLPGAFHFLQEKQRPPVDAFRAHHVPIALATDLNPGSSPMGSLLTAVNLGCVLFGLTPIEALRGVTINGARALGLADQVGSIEVGKMADLALWEIGHPRDLAYWLGRNPCVGRVFRGRVTLT